MDILDPLSDPDHWDQLVSEYSESSVFHSAAWARVLKRTYGHRPFYLSIPADRPNSPRAIIPLMEVRSPVTGRRGVSLPFSDFCEPLLPAGSDHQAVKDHLATFAHERHWKYLELRGESLTSIPSSAPRPPSSEVRPPSSAPRPPSSEIRPQPPAPRPPTFHGHRLDLTIGTEALMAACSSSVRRALRKAERSQLSVRIDHSEAAMRGFFTLHTQTRRRHGLPPQSYQFFRNVYQALVRQTSGFIVSAYASDQENPIAAAVFLTFGDKAVYKFGASDQSSWELRPNNLVMWQAIKHLSESGAKQLHFGRTSPHQDGLRRFKLSWGTQEESIHYTRYNAQSESWSPVNPDTEPSNISKLANAYFSHAPIALNRLAGKLLYPHLD